MYKGKVVLITGVSRGIGNMLGSHFLNNGATVIGLNKTKASGLNWSTCCQCDLSKPEEIMEVFERIAIHYPKIDILINNAAVLTSHYATKIPMQGAIDMVNVNLLGVFLVTRECIKLMNRVPYGRIINISSMAVALEPQGDSLYAACKAGITTMANIIAKEVAFTNITVNTLGVSAIETDMLKQLNKKKIDEVVSKLPIPRYATIEDITNVVDFFCSYNSNYITAQTIYLGGVHT